MFVVVEIQSTGETASTLVNSYIERNDAESKFHQILQYAALSEVPVHSAVLMFDTGKMIKSETYKHGVNRVETPVTD